MFGYKVFYKGLKDSFGNEYTLGKKYKLDGEVKWSQNGFHFCKRPEDTLRNFDDFNNELEIALIEASGNIVEYDDEYYGYYDMFASSEYKIIRVMSRDEIVRNVLTSRNILRQKRLLERMRLTESQLKHFKGLSIELDDVISYYQYHDTEVYQRKYKKSWLLSQLYFFI